MFFIPKIEPKKITVALEHLRWVVAMQGELAEFDRNKVQRLIPKPKDVSVVGLKLGFKNKVDKEGNVVHNKERLVVKGYYQQKDIDNDKTFSPITRAKFVRIFFAYATHKNFDVYQMDVKYPFLNGVLEDILYVQ